MDSVELLGELLPDSLFRVIIDRNGVPFVVVHLDGTLVYASASVDSVLGWSRAEILGRNMLEFLHPDDVELAIDGITEIDTVNRAGDGVPMVFRVRLPDTSYAHVEVAATPLLDVGDGDLIALRLRSWQAELHMGEFVRSLLAGDPLSRDLAPLTRSIAASMGACGAAVHHGFDGGVFVGVTGSWERASDLPLDGHPWVDGIQSDDIVECPAEGSAAVAVGAVRMWLVPIRPSSGGPPALLSIWRVDADRPLLGHRRALLQASGFIELALARAADHERLLYLARHDTLTGVANRLTFHEALDSALALREPGLAVAFCDLDGFKVVNDRYGHAVGDELLVHAAHRIAGALRRGDELARIGGDEFTILWREIDDAVAADAAGVRVVAAFDEPFPVPDGTVDIGISIGIVLADPGTTADALLAAADAALYESKQAGGSRVTRSEAG